MFPNPVAGPIHPAEWSRPAGNSEFEVTSPFGPRFLIVNGVKVASVHKGLDIGNGKGGANVLSQVAGTVVEYRPNLDGVVTVQSGIWRMVYAHMSGTSTGVGARVTVGQVLGKVGNVGAEFAHLHFENLELVDGRYVARDPWTLLQQNSGGSDVDKSFQPIHNRAAMLIPNSGHRLAPKLAEPIVWMVPSAFAIPIMGRVKGDKFEGTDEWLVYWQDQENRWQYTHEATGSSELVPIESDATAYNEGLAAAQAAVEALPDR